MELLHPGVYIREVSSGVNAIEGVGTSTAAFIGTAEMGPPGEATYITSFASEFRDNFGGFSEGGYLAPSVLQFFNNGGRKCYIVRVSGAGAAPAAIVIADRDTTTPAPTLMVSAVNAGIWGNAIEVVVRSSVLDPDNEFDLLVYRNRSVETPPQPPALLETFADLSMSKDAPNYVQKVINAGSRVVRAEVVEANFARAGKGTSQSGPLAVGNGADELKLVGGGAKATKGTDGATPTPGFLEGDVTPNESPQADRRRIAIGLDGEPPQDIVVDPAAKTGAEIAASIQAMTRALKATNPAAQPAYGKFVAEYRTPPGTAPFFYLQSGSTGATSSVQVVAATTRSDGAKVLGLGLANGGAESVGTAGSSGTSRGKGAPSTNPVSESRQFTINLDGDGPQTVVIPPAAATGADIATAIEGAVRALPPHTVANQPAYDGFEAAYVTPAAPAQPYYELTSGTTGTSSRVVVTDAYPTAADASLPTGPARFAISLNGDGPHVVEIMGPLAGGALIADAIRDKVRLITPNRAVHAAAFNAFDCKYQTTPGEGAPNLLMTSGVAGPTSRVRISEPPGPSVTRLLKLGMANGGHDISGSAALRPANSRVDNTQYHLGTATVGSNVAAVVLGADGDAPTDVDYKNAFAALDTITDVNIVAVPGISSPDVVASGVNYCTQRADCFFIGDIDPAALGIQQARAYVDSLTTKTSYGALYYPWLRMADPAGRSTQPLLVPPSGAVAGLYSRSDGRRGVFKAPAGTEANIAGIVGLAVDTTDVQQDSLNPIGLNVIRRFPASGIVVWGARTLGTRSEPEYRYIPVRRLAIFLERSIYNGIQFAVFEPNDEPLWASIRLNVGAFMFTQFRGGAFQGRSANDAFFVKCDATTTTQQDIDLGRVNVLVGFAPLKPAEFVVLQLTQKAGEATA